MLIVYYKLAEGSVLLWSLLGSILQVFSISFTDGSTWQITKGLVSIISKNMFFSDDICLEMICSIPFEGLRQESSLPRASFNGVI